MAPTLFIYAKEHVSIFSNLLKLASHTFPHKRRLEAKKKQVKHAV